MRRPTNLERLETYLEFPYTNLWLDPTLYKWKIMSERLTSLKSSVSKFSSFESVIRRERYPNISGEQISIYS
jgi:hypothetical protein